MSLEWFQVDYISGLASWVFSIFLNHDVRHKLRYNVRLPIFAGNALSWLWLISSILSSVHSDIWGGRTVTWLFDRFNEERHLSDPISLGSPISLFWLNKGENGEYYQSEVHLPDDHFVWILHGTVDVETTTIGKAQPTLEFLMFLILWRTSSQGWLIGLNWLSRVEFVRFCWN